MKLTPLSYVAIGAPSAIAGARVLAHFGHHFIQMAHQNIATIAIIGLVHNLAVLYLFEKSSKKSVAPSIQGHVIVGLALYAASILAARINLVAAGLTLYGTGTLIASGFIGTAIVKFVSAELKRREAIV